jgi:hypothetical protein
VLVDPDSQSDSHGGDTGQHTIDAVDGTRNQNLDNQAQKHAMDGGPEHF